MAESVADQVLPRLSSTARWLYYAAGVVVPVGLLLLSLEASAPEWQDQSVASYSMLVLRQLPLVFSAFFLYSAGAMLLLIATPEALAKLGRLFAVRLGVYTGAILSIHLIVLLGLAATSDWTTRAILWGANILAVLSWPFLLGARRLTRRLSAECVGTVAGAAGLIAYVAASLAFGSAETLVSLVAALIVAAPGWMLLAHLRMAWLLHGLQRHAAQFRLSALFAWVSWLAAYCGAWRLSVILALEEYAALPAVEPGCFISMAAARGHRRLVRSCPARTSRGTVVLVNPQVRRLKCAELALSVLAPRLHRACRGVYNRCGPRLARRIQSPLAADLAYLMLKPAEWTACALLWLLAPNLARAVQRICPPAPPPAEDACSRAVR